MRHLRAIVCTLLASLVGAAFADDSILHNLPVPPTHQVTTVPANGDINPYGVAFVPDGIAAGGLLHAGDVLVSNFNAGSNLQGTGTTIVRITEAGAMSLFFQGKPGLGLTTALGVLKGGFVLVGNVPTADGTSATVSPGSLLILDKSGNTVGSLTDSALLQGPWDLTINDLGNRAQIFVSNVLSGTVTRINVQVGSTVAIESETQIASGYVHRSDPAALEVGPTGLVFDAASDSIFVASTGDNAIYEVSNAAERATDGGPGRVIYKDNAHLRGPLGLVLAPNGHFIATNGDAVNSDPSHPSEMVEFTRSGHFVAQVPVNATAQGGAFGLALSGSSKKIIIAAVDDILNALDIWVVKLP